MKKMDEKVPLKTIIVKVPLDKLKIDVGNVRFSHLDEKLTEKKMEEMIWSEHDTVNLYNQIKEAKGLYEPPVINLDFVVIEGNRRVVCLRRLQKEAKEGKLPGVSKTQYDFVNCRQIASEATILDINLYLAAIHISGKKPWPLFNRAKRINELHETYNLSYDKLAKILGMGKITVIRTVDAYNQTLKYREKYNDEEDWYRKFSYFEELYRKKPLRDFVSKQENLDKFITWVHDGKFSDHRQVRSLDRILADPDARHIFETGTSDEAIRLLEEKDPTMKSREFKQITKTIRVLTSFSRRELIKTVNDPYRVKILERLREEIDNTTKGYKISRRERTEKDKRSMTLSATFLLKVQKEL